MAKSHERPESPTADTPSCPKKLKTAHLTPPDGADVTFAFANGVLHHTNIERLRTSYDENKPFHYALVEKLFQDDLLKNVKDECLSELSFTEKQTDIYKVNQTGDLASLNYLSASQISLLPNLLKLRDALYSSTFRSFLRGVTGCGPLSGTKQDMSVNSYTKGCHLLNHDDVIGTRRVSYILYMPLPHYQFWQKDWGGALELYPTKPGPNGVPEPEPVPAKSIPPSWNQFIFFQVQPGQSFHSVEEVVVGGENEDGRERLSISGWFHAAQEGEEGYEPQSESDLKSSREQLAESKTDFQPYDDSSAPLPDVELSDEHVTFLSEYLNPVYLQPRTMSALSGRFLEESSLELHSFLSNDLAQAIEPRLRELDMKDGLGPNRHGKIPPHSSGINLPESQLPNAPTTEAGVNTTVNIIPQTLVPLQGSNGAALLNGINGAPSVNGSVKSVEPPSVWTLKGPPHKWRYCTLLPPDPSAPATSVTPLSAHPSPSEILRTLQDELFSSQAFRAWLAIVSKLLPLRHFVEARRFRPGLDYTLATSEEKEARLDVVLGLTPEAVGDDEEKENAGGRRRVQRKEVKGWGAAEWGGWECYMAPHNEEDDPAVYRAGTYKKSDVLNNGNGFKAKPPSSASASSSNGHKVSGTNGTRNGNGSPHSPKTNGTSRELPNGNSSPRSVRSDDKDEPMDTDEDEEDSTLLTVQPGFNRLLLVLRDERVMRFVKYVSAAAEGSRWDVCAEYEVGMVEEEDGEGDSLKDED